MGPLYPSPKLQSLLPRKAKVYWIGYVKVMSPLPHYQQWVDAHERWPAWVGGAEGAEAAGVGVGAAGAHQDGL